MSDEKYEPERREHKKGDKLPRRDPNNKVTEEQRDNTNPKK
jgi:hypothetical protein